VVGGPCLSAHRISQPHRGHGAMDLGLCDTRGKQSAHYRPPTGRIRFNANARAVGSSREEECRL